MSAMLWYNKFCADLKDIGFDFNLCDPCIANCTVKKKQHTIRFHVDDLMSSHVNKKVNVHFLAWLEKQYGEHGKVKFMQGKLHDFLGMKMDF